jgi:hypothetical protein
VNNNNNSIIHFYDNTNPTTDILINQNYISPTNFSILILNTFIPGYSYKALLVADISHEFNQFIAYFEVGGAGLGGKPNHTTPFTINLISYVPNPQPPPFFSMRSLFTDNAQVYYKPHSLSTGSGGSGVRNSRKKQRKT